MSDKTKAPFGIIIEAQLKPGTTIAARDAAQEIVSAHSGNSDATKYWGFTTATGAGERVMLFAPFANFADLDSRPTTGNVLSANNAKADDVVTSVDANLASVTRSVVEYVPGLSNPPSDDADAPGPYIYHVKVKLKPGCTLQARELAGQIAEAYRNNPGAPKYWGYASALGDGDTYHVFLPFSQFADLDGWATTGQIMAGKDASAADSVITEIDGLIESTERSILNYVPSLSNAA